jgi:hypothetical protein
MTRKILSVAVCLAALSLAACEDNRGMRPNGRLCADFKTAKTPANSPAALADAASPVDECVRRWAYGLAPSRDDADAVADATVAACGSLLSKWNQQSLADPAPPADALSITTGQPTNPLSEHNAFAHARALFYVVQARAGHCAAPPIKDGVPEGIAN